ncbi:lysosomal acid lipase/cholesteryl ester hydrolase-like [Dermacentor andersoni]|uniref:lysosomal acid lipase/cholesteryl ester hydrolase-like n=1 Tax=Dermacentor andersoni TaxID=34620 RepID=UPI00241785ED|nr:lysosomal acid lipase/cholesteryl ester hydrolase-like [Dermacentor andersoni]
MVRNGGCAVATRVLIEPPGEVRHYYLRLESVKLKDFDEIGRYDLPAVVDYILDLTGFSKLGLLAISQGATDVLVFLSMLPEYNRKVNIFVAYAPVANITHFTTPLRLLFPLTEPLTMINDIFTHGGLLVSNPLKQMMIATACNSPLREVCYLPYAIIFGKNAKQHNSTRVPVYIASFPAGTSTKTVLHYTQVYRARNFVRFDYGILKNLVKYGQVKPPAYPLEQIRVPVAIYQGQGDNFAVPQDMDDLSERLKHVLVLKYMVPDPDFGHLDFLMGFNATAILHSHMMYLISQYTTVQLSFECDKRVHVLSPCSLRMKEKKNAVESS